MRRGGAMPPKTEGKDEKDKPADARTAGGAASREKVARELNREELEALRRKLQAKFH
jgi:hypothetical protein